MNQPGGAMFGSSVIVRVRSPDLVRLNGTATTRCSVSVEWVTADGLIRLTQLLVALSRP